MLDRADHLDLVVGPAQQRERILLISDVAESERTLPVSHQPEEVVVEGAGDLGRTREVLVLLLTDPANGIGDVDAAPIGGAVVRAAAVQHLALVEQDAAPPHLGLVERHGQPGRVIDSRRIGDDLGCPVRRSEVGQRPHRVALHVVVGGKRVKIERHLVAVQLLSRLAGGDRNDLGEVQLDRRCLGQKVLGNPDRQRMSHQHSRGWAASDQHAGAPRVASVVFVATGGGPADPRCGLGVEPLHRVGVEDVVDDGVAVLAQEFPDDCRVGGGRKVV